MAKFEIEMLDIEKILECHNTENALFQRLSSYITEFRSKNRTAIQEHNAKRKESINRRELILETIVQLHNKSKDIQSQIDNTILTQKIVNKKISNSIKVNEKLKEEIEEEKLRKINLALEMVDLQQDQDQHKTKKIQEWNAIKHAFATYKEFCNLAIDCKTLEDHDSITVTFLLNKNPEKNNYYVIISKYQDNKWKVDKMVPMLKADELKKVNLHFSMDYNLEEIRGFLYEIQNIFSRHYFSHEN